MTDAQGRDDAEPIHFLLSLGRRQGHLTYAQVNARLSEEAGPTLLDQLLTLLEQEGVELVDDPGPDGPALDAEGWPACTDPERLLAAVVEQGNARKLRLLGVARCRRAWPLFRDPRSRRAVEVAELLADGAVGEEERRRAREDAEAALLELRGRDALSTSKEFLFASAAERAAVNVLSPDPAVAAGCGADVAWCLDFFGQPAARGLLATQQEDEVALIRDVFGNPFRPPAIDPAWLARNGETTRKVAEAIYQGRAFDRLPVLADALEEAGSTAADVLSHLRGPGPHARGCHALDALLGKL